MFASPPEQSLEWKEDGVVGAHKFIKRLWKLYVENALCESTVIDLSKLQGEQKKLFAKTHETIQKVSDDYGRRHMFNTAIAAIMELSNSITKFKVNNDCDKQVIKFALDQAIILLSPVAPHMTQALWQAAGNKILIVDQSWPEVDEAALVKDEVLIILQVNGKTRGKISVAADASKDAIEALAMENENVTKFVEGKTVRKVIVVPGRLVNIVAN